VIRRQEGIFVWLSDQRRVAGDADMKLEDPRHLPIRKEIRSQVRNRSAGKTTRRRGVDIAGNLDELKRKT